MEKIIDGISYRFFKFDQLSSRDVYKMASLRAEVFIMEQGVKTKELDGKDYECIHLLAYDKDRLAGYIRILPKGLVFSDSSMGRLCVDKDYRGKKIGGKLFMLATNYIHDNMGEERVRIHAQAYLEKAYENMGYKSVSGVYLFEGIEHVEMVHEKDS